MSLQRHEYLTLSICHLLENVGLQSPWNILRVVGETILHSLEPIEHHHRSVTHPQGADVAIGFCQLQVRPAHKKTHGRDINKRAYRMGCCLQHNFAQGFSRWKGTVAVFCSGGAFQRKGLGCLWEHTTHRNVSNERINGSFLDLCLGYLCNTNHRVNTLECLWICTRFPVKFHLPILGYIFQLHISFTQTTTRISWNYEFQV